MKEFKDKVAVITGAASGIGRAMAGRFAAEGMKLVLSDIEEVALAKAEAELKAKGTTVLGVVTDVADPKAIENLAEQTYATFGAANILCNNAGVAVGGPIWENTQADWDWVLGINLMGVIHGIRIFVPKMMEGGEEGHIVNTASLAGLLCPPIHGIYNVAKHGVVALSETLHHELGLFGSKLKVSVLCPGFVDTAIIDADRNRPTEGPLKAREQEITPDQEQMKGMLRQVLAEGLAPGDVADQVFDAVKEEKFYILTHPEANEAIKARMEAILEGRNPTAEMAALDPSLLFGANAS